MDLTSEDRDLIAKMMEYSNMGTEEKRNIFNMYRKYLNPNVFDYVEGCGCKSDIQNIFKELRDFYESNK